MWMVESGTRGPFAESSRIPGDTREAVARLRGVEAAESLTYQSAEALHAGRKIRLYVVGFEPGRPGGPLAIVAGRGIARSHYEMVLDRRAGLGIGERVRLGRNMFTGVGLTENLVNSGATLPRSLHCWIRRSFSSNWRRPRRGESWRGAPMHPRRT